MRSVLPGDAACVIKLYSASEHLGFVCTTMFVADRL
jgi:hypothetical protein